jgi:alpha-galactosidase
MLEVGLGGMTDDEYKAHFTMWALLKSPLLIGADLRTLSPSALTILNNPAIIAINQDPAGRSAHRVHIDYAVKKDKYGIGETQVWSGPLAAGDQVVAFLNAADEDIHMACSLEEIFVSDGPGGSAPQAQHEWDVFDLWANRMHDGVAASLLGASSDGKPEAAVEAMKQANWYNSTTLPYADGLRLGDERLLGKKIGSVKARGELQAMVPRHGVAAFRLRSQSPNLKRYQVRRDEL